MGFCFMEKKYYGWRGGKNNRFLYDFYMYDLRHNSSDKKWQSLGSLFSFNFLVNVTGTFLRCHGHFLVFPKNVTGIFSVTGKNMIFCHGQTKNCHGHFLRSKLSRAFFRVTCIFWSFLEKVSRATENVSVEKKHFPRAQGEEV